MKVPLPAGFLALLVLLAAEVVTTNRMIAQRQRDQQDTLRVINRVPRRAGAEVRTASIDAGFDDQLAKPVEAAVLLQKAAELVARK